MTATRNAELAQQLLDEAKPLLPRRAALLCARAALGTTASLSAARTALRTWDGPDQVRRDASGILDALREVTR